MLIQRVDIGQVIEGLALETVHGAHAIVDDQPHTVLRAGGGPGSAGDAGVVIGNVDRVEPPLGAHALEDGQ